MVSPRSHAETERAYPLVLRPWHLRWGATDSEVHGALPGDGLVPHPVFQTTRAITIQAPAEAVWPWLVQMGQGRGGMHSYERLENLVGSDLHNVDRIMPELQDLKVGDAVWMVPPARFPNGPHFTVAAMEPNRALVLQAPGEGETPAPNSFSFSWAFVLDRVGESTTRLVVRARSYAEPAWMAPLMDVEPIHFVMERKMLRGMKDRAERAAR